LLQGDATLARQKLGWRPTIDFRELVPMMVEHDLKLAESGR
jgi:GDP-D-mannose dehydratase